MRRRSEFNVIAKILRIAAKSSKKKEVLERCKMDSMVLENYLLALTELRLLIAEEKSENCYRTTEKGFEFLRFYHGLRWLLWGKEFDFLLINILIRLKKHTHPYYVR